MFFRNTLKRSSRIFDTFSRSYAVRTIKEKNEICLNNANVNLKNLLLHTNAQVKNENSSTFPAFKDNEDRYLFYKSTQVHLNYFTGSRTLIINTPILPEINTTASNKLELISNILNQSNQYFGTPFGGLYLHEDYLSLTSTLDMQILDEFQLLYKLDSIIEYTKIWKSICNKYLLSGSYYNFPFEEFSQWYQPNLLPSTEHKNSVFNNAASSFFALTQFLSLDVDMPTENFQTFELSKLFENRGVYSQFDILYHIENMCFIVRAPILDAVTLDHLSNNEFYFTLLSEQELKLGG